MQPKDGRLYPSQNRGSSYGGPSSSQAQSEPMAAFILAGKTGSGKSTFIKMLGGRDLTGDEPVVDGGLDSCTKSPTVYLTTLNSRKILLLDTPGFDDSGIDNLEVLNEVVASLYTFALRPHDIQTHGVIFLHDISETRFGGSQRKTLEILKALCGPKGMKNCIVGTTMWNTPETSKFKNEEIREKDFLRTHWRGILKTTRIAEHNQHAVVGIVSDLLNQPPILLQAQEEMLKPPHTFEATTAGRVALPEGRAEAEQLRAEFERQREEFEREKRRREVEFDRDMERNRKQFEEERTRLEEENQRRRDEQQQQDDEQRRRHQEDMRNLDNEHQRQMGEELRKRRAQEQERQNEEREKWAEFVRSREEEARKAEERRQQQFEQYRKQQEKEAREARERDEERLRVFMEEYRKAQQEPEPMPWLGKLLGTVANVAMKFLGPKLGLIFS